MKKILFLATATILAASMFAQNTFNKGDKVINLGIGIGNTLYSGSGYSTTFPPLSAAFDYGIVDHLLNNKASIGIGGYVGYSTSKYENGFLNEIWGYKYSNLVIGARGSFHYQLVDNLDTYAGIMIGYDVVSAKSYGTNNYGGIVYAVSSSGIITSGFIGARYYLTPKIGAFAELGYGVAVLNVGVNFKL